MVTRRRRGHADQAARARLAVAVAAGRAVCRRCRLPIPPDAPAELWDAGHLVDLQLGGDAAGPVEVEHARRADCPAGGNRSAGAKLQHELASRRRRRLPRRQPG